VTTSDHAAWVDCAGAYVLGAMAPDEREHFEVHLAACTICREEVDELRPAAEALPMASPQMVPTQALKDRIMAEVEREAELLAQAGASADRPEPARARRSRGWWPPSGWRLAPVAAALLIAGVLAGTALDGTARDGTATRSISADVKAPGASAQLQVAGEKATLVARNLPAPPAGRVYEVWIMPKGSATPRPTSVLFVPRGDGSAEAAIPGSVSDTQKVLVTDEPSAGSDTPTGKVILSATTT
jgi:anti-sigma-K factor RskA